MKQVSWLQLVDYCPLRIFGCLHLLDRMVKVRIELLPRGFHTHQALFRQQIAQLTLDQLEPLAIFGACRTWIGGERVTKRVEDRKKALGEELDAPMVILMALSFDPLAVILEVGLPPHESIL